MDYEHGGLFYDLVFIPTHKHLTNPIESRNNRDILNEFALLDLDGACRLVCFDTSNKSVAQFLYGWRPEVNVVKLIFKGLIVMDFNSFLQGTFNHSNFAVGLESIHVASEHANAFPFVNVAGAVVFNLV